VLTGKYFGISPWIGVSFTIIFGYYHTLIDVGVCQPNARNPCLRQILGYKGPWKYYCAMISDVILRFSWVIYILQTQNLQHASIANFLIGFIEVTRRGMWMLFRVEVCLCALHTKALDIWLTISDTRMNIAQSKWRTCKLRPPQP
jgi:hypothetical protein